MPRRCRRLHFVGGLFPAMRKGKRRIEITDAGEGAKPADAEGASEMTEKDMPDEVDEERSESDLEETTDVDELRSEIGRLKRELEEEHDRHLRAVAELQNYRRRVSRESREQSRYAGQEVLSRILPVMDNLQRVLEHEAESGTEDFAIGVRMTVEEFFRVLDQLGVTVIDCAGESFDPAMHDAVARIETDEVPAGTIVDVDTPGYCLHDRCLRPARVVVAADAQDE